MKNKFAIFVFMLFTCTNISIAQTAKLSPTAVLLFKNVKSKLTIIEKNAIAANLGFVLAPDRQSFAQDKASLEYPFTAEVYPTDLNNDGTEELFVSFGNSYTSGATGASIVLYIKGATGAYHANLGFPGTLPDVISSTNKGYPDLVIGGPGFSFPIWRWKGSEYVLHKTINDRQLTAMKLKNVADYSRQYQNTLK
ncbi:MAG TPA: hypothetical protein VL098_02930 [Flavipsychrobacter sp.]|nr:hypothetical protein [Flavipsychrobacter sp.]